MTFEYKTEKELCSYLENDFSSHFGCEFKAREYALQGGGRVDFLGENENHVYVIEVKKELATNESVKQLNKYMDSIITSKEVFGILVAPKISKEIDYSLMPPNMSIKEIKNVLFISDRRTGIDVPAILDNEIQKYMEKNGIKTWNTALWELVRKGLEKQNPSL